MFKASDSVRFLTQRFQIRSKYPLKGAAARRAVAPIGGLLTAGRNRRKALPDHRFDPKGFGTIVGH
jgi:hypothetical protein